MSGSPCHNRFVCRFRLFTRGLKLINEEYKLTCTRYFRRERPEQEGHTLKLDEERRAERERGIALLPFA